MFNLSNPMEETSKISSMSKHWRKKMLKPTHTKENSENYELLPIWVKDIPGLDNSQSLTKMASPCFQKRRLIDLVRFKETVGKNHSTQRSL
jgi:hypothetical protein